MATCDSSDSPLKYLSTRVAQMNITLTLLLVVQVYCAVMSIDFGTEWLKVAIVKGSNVQIVLNTETKRKTANTVLVSHTDRKFSSMAANSVKTNSNL